MLTNVTSQYPTRTFFSNNSIFDDFLSDAKEKEENILTPQVLNRDQLDSLKQQLVNNTPRYPVTNFKIGENGTNIIEIAVTGKDKSDMDVSVKNNVLTVSCDGEKKEETEKEEVIFKKIAERSFFIQYKLSDQMDIKEITSSLKNGILRIEIPLKKEAIKEKEKRTIKIN